MTEGFQFNDGQSRVIAFGKLSNVAAAEWVALFNNPDVRLHLPLAGSDWDEDGARKWAEDKDAQWATNLFGPWSIKIDGDFAGWGGFQKEDMNADLGLVLLPRFWGVGKVLFREMLNWADLRELPDVTILLPPSRTRLLGLSRLGFVAEGEMDYDGERFLKFRLDRDRARE